MLSQEIRKLARHCCSLRRRKEALGHQLDDLGTGPQYAAVDVLYGKLFDQLWEAEDAILTAPATSTCDLAAKAKIIAERARLDVDLSCEIALLVQWKAAPIECR
jgi:hypothetical protein